MKVPRELDELMWAVAEQRNPETNEQFLERYPEFAGELDQRVKMVSDLRGSRPKCAPSQFVPRETVRQFGPSRLAIAGVAVLVLASVTFATFATVQFVNAKRSPRVLAEKLPEVIFTPPTFPVPGPTEGTGLEGMTPKEPLGTSPQPEQPIVQFDPYMGLVTIESEDIQLSAAIEQIATRAGLRAQIAPGFEEKRIKISFVNRPAIDVLKILGDHFGFVAVKDGTVDLLIIPQKKDAMQEAPVGPGSVGTATGAGEGDNGPVKKADTKVTGGNSGQP